MRRPHPVLLVMCGVALLAGCDSPAATGPQLRLGGDPGSSCVATQPGATVLVGEVAETPDKPVTLADVTLAAPQGVKVVAQFVLPTSGAIIGSSDYPPTDIPEWDLRVPAEGAELAANTSYNLVLQVTRIGSEPGKTESMTVRYSADGSEAETAGSTRYEFTDACS